MKWEGGEGIPHSHTAGSTAAHRGGSGGCEWLPHPWAKLGTGGETPAPASWC